MPSLITGLMMVSKDDDAGGNLDGLMMDIPSGEVIRVTGTLDIDLYSLFFNELLSLLLFLDCCGC